MTEKVLITGITGMAGSHLADYLLTHVPSLVIYGTVRKHSNLENIRHILEHVNLFECDLLEQRSCDEVIQKVAPDYIFHLSGLTSIPDSWNNPLSTITENIAMQLNLLEAVRKAEQDPIIVIALSSDEYGALAENEIPIKENSLFRPTSPYAVSKIGQDMLAYQYFKTYGMRIIRMRPFNHDGPRRSDAFATGSFARQIAEIEMGLREPIVIVGNLNAHRDWSDVRDVVRGYWLASQHCEIGEDYNICSGKARSVRSILDLLLQQSKMEIKINIDSKRFRNIDQPVVIGDSTKFTSISGWKPNISFEQTMKDVLTFWRQKVRVLNYTKG